MAQVTAREGSRVVDGVEVPVAGTYVIDKAHSMVEFVGRYLMVTKVRGRFTDFSGEFDVAEDPLQSSVAVTIDATSVHTGDERRDGHLRGGDFLDVETYPTIEFRSRRLQPSGRDWKLIGDLTLHGVTREVTLDLSFDGFAPDPWGNTRLAFSASTEIDREDWGLTWNAAIETGGVLVGRKVTIELTIQALPKKD
jgi:polyisoprenoid-binding protein YceI